MPSSIVSNHQLVDGGTFTNIGAIGTITMLYFSRFGVKIYINIALFFNMF